VAGLTGARLRPILRGATRTRQETFMKRQAEQGAGKKPHTPKGHNAQGRRADALRENLRKRKTQAKGRQKQETDTCP